jgi:hypothetical protein
MDGSAYVDKETWLRVLESVDLDIIRAREGRYDAIFHLVTAADGAPAYYTLATNTTRRESAESAITQDRLTQQAWSGHPHHIIIGNSKGKTFEDKLNELQSKMASFVGLSSGKSHMKYILTKEPIIGLIPNLHSFDIEKIFLKERIRSSSINNFNEYNTGTSIDTFANSRGCLLFIIIIIIIIITINKNYIALFAKEHKEIYIVMGSPVTY